MVFLPANHHMWHVIGSLQQLQPPKTWRGVVEQSCVFDRVENVSIHMMGIGWATLLVLVLL